MLSQSNASFTNAMSIEVIDPMNRTGKITLPLQYVYETRGVTESRSPSPCGAAGPKDMSLCLLFQKGRCNAGARCHQIHADPEFVTKLRLQAAACSACCALHGDFNSQGFLQVAGSVAVVDGLHQQQEATLYSLSAFARTAAMDAALANARGQTIRVQAGKVCRLHQQGRCKFGRDCKNLHLCPKAAPLVAQPAPLAPSAAAQRVAPLLKAPSPIAATLDGAAAPKAAVFGWQRVASAAEAANGASQQYGASSVNGLSQASTPRRSPSSESDILNASAMLASHHGKGCEVAAGAFTLPLPVVSGCLERSVRPVMPLCCIGSAPSTTIGVRPLAASTLLEASLTSFRTLHGSSMRSPTMFETVGFEDTLSLLLEDLAALHSSPSAASPLVRAP